jgi:transposase
MKPVSQHFAALIGLDWADKKHDICLLERQQVEEEYGVIKHNPEAIHEWALALQERFKNEPIAICLELKAGPVVYALLKYSFITLFPISPKALSKYRDSFSQSGAKDDPTDAFLQLDYLLKHPEALKPLQPADPQTRILQRLVEDRRHFVQDKVDLTNHLTATLKSYYPQVLQWFEDIDTALFCGFMLRWPTLADAQRASTEELTTFFKANNCVRNTVIERRISAIAGAMPLTEDEGVIVPMRKLSLRLVSQLMLTLETIREYDDDIANRFKDHVDYKLFDSLPGAGAVFGPRLLAAFGSNRDRYGSADELARFSGVAPVLKRSGQKSWVHWRYACPKFLRQTFVEWAYQTTKYSFWAKEFYEKKRAEGKHHQATLRMLAFKWIRVLFRCWQTNTPYDESAYLFALKRRKAVEI